MSTEFKRRRGTTAEHAAFIGQDGEVTVDTTKKATVVHDGVTAGGFPMAGTKYQNTFTVPQSFTGGTASAPAIASASNQNTGLFFPLPNTVAVATGGAERMRIDAGGTVTVTAGNLNLANAFYLNGRNAANTANIPIVKVNASDVLEFGSGGYNAQFVGNIGIGVAADNAVRAVVRGSGNTTSTYGFVIQNADGLNSLAVSDSRETYLYGPTLVITPSLLGYGTGAGGTVAQATSKGTAVTLNKPCGQITMNNAALGAGAIAGFILKNTLLTPNDIVLVNIANVGVSTYNAYRVYAAEIGSGRCAIYLTNTGGSSLSESVVINFAIIKGSAS